MSTAFKRRAGSLLMRALLYLNSYGQLQITQSVHDIGRKCGYTTTLYTAGQASHSAYFCMLQIERCSLGHLLSISLLCRTKLDFCWQFGLSCSYHYIVMRRGLPVAFSCPMINWQRILINITWLAPSTLACSR